MSQWENTTIYLSISRDYQYLSSVILLMSLMILRFNKGYVFRARLEGVYLLCSYSEMAAYAGVILMPSSLTCRVVYVACWLDHPQDWLLEPLYVLGFSQHGIWVPKRQPG